MEKENVSQKKRRFGSFKEKVLKTFDVSEDTLDNAQLNLIDKTLDKSMLITGCAGSGKSVIAMYKAQQIMDAGEDVIMIAFTKSLSRYMYQGKGDWHLGERFYYHWQWEHAGCPSADYIIVDEIQDFSMEEIKMFISAARKNYFFFGDTAQSIYKGIKKTMTVEDIQKMTGLEPLVLYNNYRLPKAVAKITQNYVANSPEYGFDGFAARYAERVYQSKENSMPSFIQFIDDKELTANIIKLIKENNYKNVGIFVPRNEQVLHLKALFEKNNFDFELKYNADDFSSNIDTLDFKTTKPKLMTYHSAKGLQFETVILPYYEGAADVEARKALYVAMTRTYRYLYVMYIGELMAPLSDVDSILYKSVAATRKTTIYKKDEREAIKELYPGLEAIVDLLLDNDIPFSHDGDVELIDEHGTVVAQAGLLLQDAKIAINPDSEKSKRNFEQAGYHTVLAGDFNISMVE